MFQAWLALTWSPPDLQGFPQVCKASRPMDLLNPGLKVNLVLTHFHPLSVFSCARAAKLISSEFPPVRTDGECCCSIQSSPEVDSPSAHWQTLARSSLCAPRCLPSDAPSDTVPGSACPAPSHDAASEAEPHYPHSKTPRAGPSGDPPGERIQVSGTTRVQST